MLNLQNNKLKYGRRTRIQIGVQTSESWFTLQITGTNHSRLEFWGYARAQHECLEPIQEETSRCLVERSQCSPPCQLRLISVLGLRFHLHYHLCREAWMSLAGESAIMGRLAEPDNASCRPIATTTTRDCNFFANLPCNCICPMPLIPNSPLFLVLLNKSSGLIKYCFSLCITTNKQHKLQLPSQLQACSTFLWGAQPEMWKCDCQLS